MTFLTENELAKHIALHKRLSLVFLVFTLSAILSFIFFILFLIAKMVAGLVVCFLICAFSIVILVEITQYNKKETAKTNHYPYEIILDREFNFDEIKLILSQQTSDDKCRSFENESAFLCFMNKIYENRFLLINILDFNKSIFDSIKGKINKRINKEFQVSSLVSRGRAAKMMRTNLILSNEMNESLYAYLSNNAGVLLRRVEGIINLAIVKNRLIIPPLYGDVDIMEVSRYNNSIKLIKSLFQ